MIRPARIIDLTLLLRRGMRGVDWTTTCTLQRDGWNATTLQLYSHAGTHMDAPHHFGVSAETIDQIPLERCAGIARVVSLPNTRPRERLTVEHLGEVGRTFSPGEVLLLATGWSRWWDEPERYREQLPWVSEELANWCVEHGVQVLGVEPPSVADVTNRAELTRIHQMLLGGGVTIVEGLTNLDQLTDRTSWFVAAPLKIEGGDGCPCRAFALEM